MRGIRGHAQHSSNVAGSLVAHAVSFVSKYHQYIFRGPIFSIQPLSGQDLLDECCTGPYTAGGLDGWSPEDFSILSLESFNFLACLLNGIEGGLPWPDGLLHGKASFLSKTDVPSADPLKYRILLLLPTLYRKWGTTRLRQLRPWVETWAVEGMYAGIPGQGAEDAWWLTSIVLESAALAGKKLSGGAVDMLKCFDSINRTLAIMLLQAAGMPVGIITAYKSYHDNVVVYNSLAGGLGKPYHKRCSIPQGCPFSMLIIALMMRPWILISNIEGLVNARVLADDLLLLGIGANHLQAFIFAFSRTHEYLHDLGASISADKSFIFFK